MPSPSPNARPRPLEPARPSAPWHTADPPCPIKLSDLIEGIKRRDRAAYRDLYALYRGRVLSYAKHLVYCEHAAQDIVQEAFERIWRYASSFDSARTRHPDGWIFQIVRNQSMNELSRRGRLIELVETHEADLSFWSNTGDPDADRMLNLAALSAAQARLPSTYRQVLFLRFDLDLSLHEIAEHLDIPIGTAKTWLRRALIALREELRTAHAKPKKACDSHCS